MSATDATNPAVRPLALTPASLTTLQARAEPMPRRLAAATPADAPPATAPIAAGRGRLVNIVV